MTRQELEIKAAAVIEKKKRAAIERSKSRTVYGIVNMQREVIRCWTITNGDCVPSVGGEPSVLIPEKLERLITVKKKNKVIYGGRGGAKSMTVMDILAAEVKDDGSHIMCFREVQKSLKESVFKGLVGEIKRLGFMGFTPVESQGEVRHENKGLFSFWGLNSNLTNMKSLYGYKRFWNEEAEATSQQSLDVMGPTLRGMPNTEIWHTFNARSAADAIAQTFIVPYEKEIRRNGFYEDEYNLIIKVGYQDNPWFELDQSLVDALEADRQKVRDGAMAQTKFDWIWGGEFYDEVDGSIIKAEWFDAAIDAHKIDRLKNLFKPRGAVIAAHDPSDTGNDDAGFAIRHGSVIEVVNAKGDCEIDVKCDWAADQSLRQRVDWFVWDGDGMGTGLKRQIADSFDGTRVKWHMFKGSNSGSGQDNAEDIYMNDARQVGEEPVTYADTFKNNRSQYYTELADRFYNTYRVVVKGEYADIDEMISLNSEGIEDMAGLRSECCRVPIKPVQAGGLIQIMSKADMAKLQISSPNMSDCLMMVMWKPRVRSRTKAARVAHGAQTDYDPLNY